MPTIIYKQENMFDAKAQAIVNPINCVGVMGAGIALQFKHRFPKCFKLYKQACDRYLIKPGKMFICLNDNAKEDLTHRYLINFPTKHHWRNPSKMYYITEGMIDLVKRIKELNIKSIAIPALGCGKGGLEWKNVKPVIERELDSLDDDVTVFIYEPQKIIFTTQV